MIKLAANLSMLFTEVDFLERFRQAKENNFDFIEFLFPYDHKPEIIANIISDSGLSIELFNLPPGDWNKGERGLAALPQHRTQFLKSVDIALEYANKLGVKKLHCMAGLGDFENAELHKTYVENLAYAANTLQQHNIVLLIEPLNTLNMPGYFLNSFDKAATIIDEIPNVFLQFDIFHCQKIHGNISYYLEKYKNISKHYQIAGVPQRFEPAIGELNYNYILHKIDTMGYDGAIGCEYNPQYDTISGLSWRRSIQ